VPPNALAAVTGIGLSTSLGANAAQACASFRAGLARFRLSERHLCVPLEEGDGDLEPSTVAPARCFTGPAEGIERLLQLSFPALAEAVRDARISRADLARGGLCIALPQASRPESAGWEDAFADALCRRAGLPKPETVTVSRAGHSGFVEAARSAVAVLNERREAVTVVLAVDSFLDAATLVWLDERGRLKCSRSPEGVIAGEAAAACVLERASRAASRGARVWETIEAIGVAAEPATYWLDLAGTHACTGEGLARAVGAAASQLAEPPAPPWVLSDHNGERYRALEWGYVVSRQHALLANLRDTWFIADALGDVGAAAGGVLAARAAHAFARGYAPARRAILVGSSDDGARGALVLGAPQNGGS